MSTDTYNVIHDLIARARAQADLLKSLAGAAMEADLEAVTIKTHTLYETAAALDETLDFARDYLNDLATVAGGIRRKDRDD